MTWVLLLLQIFGPVLAEILKRIILNYIPQLPKAERSQARAEVRAVMRRSLRRDKAAAHGYAAACSEDDVKARLEKIERKFSQRVAEIKAASSGAMA